MEARTEPEVKKRGRGRPRKRRSSEEEVEEGGNDADAKKSLAAKKQALDMRWKPLVGRYVLKVFEGSGVFLGKVVYYDSGLYRVDYEDGDCEDLDSKELREIVLGDGELNDGLSFRRRKLDELLLRKSEDKKRKEKEEEERKEKKEVADLKNVSDGVEVSALSEVENDGDQLDGCADSSSDSCEDVEFKDLGSQVGAAAPDVPPPLLPPSSGTVGVPEEYVSHLFSVYGFLRSFSIPLFLSPFTLDDLVGALNCGVQNTLLDAIHVALLRALCRHLETLSSDGSELALKCLRLIDWNLLDSLTWPVYLVHYITEMGYVREPEWKGFYDDLLKKEYYSTPVGRKLLILQILCNDVLDYAEIRSEIDMREELEVGIDSDAVTANLAENGPRRVHPRYSKTSACKEREAMEIISESHGNKSSYSSKYLGLKGPVRDADVNVDANSDECRLCRMDGTLICCDGCPSAYHSRCIGVVKMYIPEGPWYCPECTMNKLGPTITTGTSLKGAELFGIDLYEQVFLGTCNHLVVLKTSNEPCLRYYNQKDIPKVLQVLCGSVQHRLSYLEICKAIAVYWHIPLGVFSSLEMIERGVEMASVKEDEKITTASVPSSLRIPDIVLAENETSANGDNVNNGVVSYNAISVQETILADSHGIKDNGSAKVTQNGHLTSMRLPEQIKMESTGSVDHQGDQSDITQQSLVERSGAEITTCTSANSYGSQIGHANGSWSPFAMPSQSKAGDCAGCGNGIGNAMDDCLIVGTYFRPYSYINNYMHGDFAAAAAANLAILSSEESRTSEAQKTGCARKAASDISLQTKAFSMSASRFFWPSSEKKLMEVPRERCGWCYTCKLTSSNKRGCMLNAAALAATKATIKIVSGLRPLLNGAGSLPSIAAYILYMGEVLCGLTDGPFLSASYRNQWRKQVEDASTCSAMKVPLLELEKNIRTVALSADWIRGMDDCLVESSMVQNGASTIGTSQKRGPGGKRQRKNSCLSDLTSDDCPDKSFVWWRGGKLLKLVLDQAILPQSICRHAALQGGSRKILGIYYGDDSEVPKRSRQLVWRAAVERSKTASQLALQVRYLDLHVRWIDLVRPEQNLLDGKSPETEASFFRNAVICDKKVEANGVRYGVAFGNQKHLPSRIMKNIIEIEQSEDGKEKYWFSETYVPLYLIKEYEVKVDTVVLPSARKHVSELSELQRKQLKASRSDIFSYLACKRDNLEKCSCAACHLDVLLRNVVKCSACQGFCHKECTRTLSTYTNQVEFLITCKKCCQPRTVAHIERSSESVITPLPLHTRECYNPTIPKGAGIKVCNQSLVSVRTQESSSETKRATSASSTAKKERSKCNWGVIWRKKNMQDTGDDFRRKNILLRGSSDGSCLRPTCLLCKKPYNSDLLYIHCETCNNWFHAEAVDLEESRLSDVVGYKCCRCRRIRPPPCPYKDDSEGGNLSKSALKRGNNNVDSDSGTIAESIVCEPTTPMFPMEEVSLQDEDPLHFSVSRIELIMEQNSGANFEGNAGQGPQKLPVRRHLKPQSDDYVSENTLYYGEMTTPFEASNVNPKEDSSFAWWNASNNEVAGEMLFDYEGFNYEDMEFEPQTYFSFTELLSSENELDGVDAAPQDVATSQCPVGVLGDQMEPVVASDTADKRQPCEICSRLEVAPDLSCEICGLVIHRHCSPWIESSPAEASWRCGNCREWQ